jgi:TPR repeat protein
LKEALQLARAALANTTLPLGTRNVHSKAYETARQADAEKLTREVTELARRIETVLQKQSLAEKGDAEAAYAMSQVFAPLDVELLWYKHSQQLSGKKTDHIRWLRRAAEAGHVDAIHSMVAVAPDKEKRTWEIEVARLKAQNENLTAQEMFVLANKLMDSGKEAEALKWYRQAADRGVQPAQKIVLQHTDPTVVRLKAIGDANAMFELGEYFRVGNWDGVDGEDALQWYLKASARGVAEASYQAALGSIAEREKLMQRAAEQGHAGAAQWLATVRHEREQKAEREKQAAEAQRLQQQQQAAQEQAERQAFIARIDQQGSADRYQIELYCNYGGRRCTELRNAALRAQAQYNRQGQTPASGQDEASQRWGEANRKRSECLQRQAEAQRRYHRGLQTTYDDGPC